MSSKVSVICLVLGMTLAYSFYHQSWQRKFFEQSHSLILKKLPSFSLQDTFNDSSVNEKNLFEFESENSKLSLVHFWATWCAPCEVELPDFIALAEEFEKKSISFLLVAVNDEDKKIKKFFKRFKKLPGNLRVVHDNEGKVSARFGTVKLPETYIFTASGKHVDKYVGAHDWKRAGVRDRLNFYLSK